MGLSNAANLSDVIIFSVYRKELQEEDNKLNHILAESVLIDNHINYVEAIGVYMSDKEQCFICTVRNGGEEIIAELCRIYNQECYMIATQHKHGLRKVQFAYPPHNKFVGYLKEVPKEVALVSGGYTYRPDVDKYWTIISTDNTQPHK